MSDIEELDDLTTDNMMEYFHLMAGMNVMVAAFGTIHHIRGKNVSGNITLNEGEIKNMSRDELGTHLFKKVNEVKKNIKIFLEKSENIRFLNVLTIREKQIIYEQSAPNAQSDR